MGYMQNIDPTEVDLSEVRPACGMGMGYQVVDGVKRVCILMAYHDESGNQVTVAHAIDPEDVQPICDVLILLDREREDN